MATVPIERQFAGQARLVRLLLWRIGDSTDIDLCLAEARIANMIDAEDEAFLRQCMAAEEALRETDSMEVAKTANAVGFPITKEAGVRLRRCVDKLNRADAA